MASFNKKTWLARSGIGLNKFVDTITGTSFEFRSTPDSIESPGTPLTADNFNDLEARIAAAVTELDTHLSRAYTHANATRSGTTITITSIYPPRGNSPDYDVRFVAPSDFSVNDSYVIDGTSVILTDLMGAPLSEAWVLGAVVTLSKSGTRAFFKAGGASLNYKVLTAASANALPTPANQNRMYIITNTPLPARPAQQYAFYIFPATLPESFPEGFVWLQMGNTGWQFDALKYTSGGSINISPTNAWQKQNGKFVLMSAYGDFTYPPNTWTLFSTGAYPIFDGAVSGAVNNIGVITYAFGSGQDFNISVTSGSVVPGYVIKQQSRALVGSAGGSHGAFGWDRIDVTKHTVLRVTVVATGGTPVRHRAGLLNSTSFAQNAGNNRYQFTDWGKYITFSASGTYELDVTDQIGLKYFGFETEADSTALTYYEISKIDII